MNYVFLSYARPDQRRIEQLAAALSSRTRAVILAHTLGNPFDVDRVKAVAERHGLWLIEDNCDAVGSTWQGQKAGTFGDLATVSFYPAHHMTMGEGGAVLTPNPRMKKIVESSSATIRISSLGAIWRDASGFRMISPCAVRMPMGTPSATGPSRRRSTP